MWCRIIVSDTRGNTVAERCFEVFPPGNYFVVEKHYYEYLRNMKQLFDRYHYVIAYLARILLSDLRYLRSTHSAKNRVIARLYKFIRIIEEVGLMQYYEEEVEELKRLLEVMVRVKKDYHRIRDPVHELLYPRLRNTLESFTEAEIWYKLDETWRRKAYVKIVYMLNTYTGEYRHGIELCIDIRDRYSGCSDLDNKQLENILVKQRERSINNYEEMTEKYMECLWRGVDDCFWLDPIPLPHRTPEILESEK